MQFALFAMTLAKPCLIGRRPRSFRFVVVVEMEVKGEVGKAKSCAVETLL